VAVVGSDGKVQLRPITIGRDYGATLEVLGGISPADQIVINPADSLEDGQPVNVAPPPPDQPKQAQPQQVQKPQSQNQNQNRRGQPGGAS